MAAKIGLLDIETSPNIGYTWGKYDQNVIEFTQPSFILCFAWKWFKEDGVLSFAMPDYPLYQTDKTNDKRVVEALHSLFNEADIIVAHNGDAFDIKRSNARFIAHNLEPPSPYKTVDTLKLAKKHFRFDGNSLKDLGSLLEVGQKGTTGGFKLWTGCLAGDVSSWERMIQYNAQDVIVLEGVYEKLRPWSTTHPNLQLYSDFPQESCPHCGSTNVQRRGYSHLKTQVKQRFQCLSCKSWYSGKLVKK